MSPTCSRRKVDLGSTGTRQLASLDASDDIHKDDEDGARATPPNEHRGDA
jgi:hypothetical protein